MWMCGCVLSVGDWRVARLLCRGAAVALLLQSQVTRVDASCREYMATAFLVLTVFATVVDKHGRHSESGLKVTRFPASVLGGMHHADCPHVLCWRR